MAALGSRLLGGRPQKRQPLLTTSHPECMHQHDPHRCCWPQLRGTSVSVRCPTAQVLFFSFFPHCFCPLQDKVAMHSPFIRSGGLCFPPWGCISTYLDSFLIIKNKLKFRSNIYRTYRRAMEMILGLLGTQFENHWPRQHGHDAHTVVCCCSVAKSCPTLWDPMDCSTSGSPGLHHLPELAQIHVHWVDDAI